MLYNLEVTCPPHLVPVAAPPTVVTAASLNPHPHEQTETFALLLGTSTQKLLSLHVHGGFLRLLLTYQNPNQASSSLPKDSLEYFKENHPCSTTMVQTLDHPSVWMALCPMTG